MLDDVQMIEELKALVQEHPKSYWRTLQLEGNELAAWMKMQVPFLFT